MPKAILRGRHFSSRLRLGGTSVEEQNGLALDLAVAERGHRGCDVSPAHLQPNLGLELPAAEEGSQEGKVSAKRLDPGLVDEEALDAAQLAGREAAQPDACLLAARPAVEDDDPGS